MTLWRGNQRNVIDRGHSTPDEIVADYEQSMINCFFNGNINKISSIVVYFRNYQGFPRGFPRAWYFYCGKTTVISVQAVTVIKYN